MIKRLLCFAASLAAVITATAGPVSPRQAMTRLTGSAAIRSTGTQAPTSLRLAELNPLQADSCHALYIFTDETGGYYIAPTDDNAPALLGYGKGLDPQDIPSNMLAWLAGYSRQVEWLAANPQAAAPKAAVHAEIAPLVTTKWNQSAPYYNQCPMHNGKRSVTGCVATAMAQLINYNEWPKGNGYGTLLCMERTDADVQLRRHIVQLEPDARQIHRLKPRGKQQCRGLAHVRLRCVGGHELQLVRIRRRHFPMRHRSD